MYEYDIAWDYELDDYITSSEKKKIKTIYDNLKKILNKYPIKQFKIYCIILPDNFLGVYCRGTSELPIIGLDFQNIKVACEKYHVNLDIAIKTTILHEYKHALQEFENKEFDEVEAEDFAYMLS